MPGIFENLNRRAEEGRAAVVLIDVQNDFLHPDGFFSRSGYLALEQPARADFVQHCQELTQAARKRKLPVVYVQTVLRADHRDSSLSPTWYERGFGPESKCLVEGTWQCQIIDELRPEESDFVVTKKGHGAFKDTALDRVLTNLGVIHCLIAGFGGVSGGVDDTARQGAPLGYELTIVGDATYPPNDPHLATLDHSAQLMSSQEAVGFLAHKRWPGQPALRRNELSHNLALLVVDLQNDSVHPQGANARFGVSSVTPAQLDMLIQNNQRLITAMKARGKPVIYIRPTYRADELDTCASTAYYRKMSAVMPIGSKHKDRSWGNRFVEGLEPKARDLILTKKTHSAFTFTHLHRLLRNLNVDSCIVTGGSIKGCAGDTIRDGIALGYQMTPVSDATYVPNSPYLKVLADRTHIMTTDEVLALLNMMKARRLKLAR